MVGWLGQKRILSKAPGWRNSIDAGSNPSFSMRCQEKKIQAAASVRQT